MVTNDLEKVMGALPPSLQMTPRWSGNTIPCPRAGLPTEGHTQAEEMGLWEYSEFSKGKYSALYLGRKMPWPEDLPDGE